MLENREPFCKIQSKRAHMLGVVSQAGLEESRNSWEMSAGQIRPRFDHIRGEFDRLWAKFSILC